MKRTFEKWKLVDLIKYLNDNGHEDLFVRFTYLWERRNVFSCDFEYSFEGKLSEFIKHINDYFEEDFLEDIEDYCLFDTYNKEEIYCDNLEEDLDSNTELLIHVVFEGDI